MPLNDTKLRRIDGKPYDGPEELADAGGLSVRISPKGNIAFQFRYRFAGRPVRLRLGIYGKISLREAREAMEQCKKWLAEGRNPAAMMRMAKAEAVASPDINMLVAEWLDSPPALKLVKYDYWKRMLALHVTDRYGKMLADEMAPTDWEQIFRRINDGGSPVQAGNVLVKMKQVIRYGLRRRRITSSALLLLELNDVGKLAQNGERFLDDQEVGIFWRSVGKTKMSQQNQLFVRLVLLTGCRGVELRLAKKKDFDLGRRIWTIRKEISKTRRGFVRGLSAAAVELLEQAFLIYPDFEIVFPPATLQVDRPMSANVLLSLADQVGEVMNITDWTMHDLRRTCKTQMAKLGVAPHVSEKILGHKLTGMLAVYDQHDYVEEQQQAADLWASHIHSCSSIRP
ncbi:site-specific integrase [Sodalis sp. dw_96]|uniref:tyrosine-type recombinase/integrase n=1 Tax=Sodalis sp. dw_96 TaxID=2719794 RepID=UPI001BD25CFC|nr:site-specific integrase [Sodalis sp. dw_96]